MSRARLFSGEKATDMAKTTEASFFLRLQLLGWALQRPRPLASGSRSYVIEDQNTLVAFDGKNAPNASENSHFEVCISFELQERKRVQSDGRRLLHSVSALRHWKCYREFNPPKVGSMASLPALD